MPEHFARAMCGRARPSLSPWSGIAQYGKFPLRLALAQRIHNIGNAAISAAPHPEIIERRSITHAA
jgi:hypothetical protein